MRTTQASKRKRTMDYDKNDFEVLELKSLRQLLIPIVKIVCLVHLVHKKLHTERRNISMRHHCARMFCELAVGGTDRQGRASCSAVITIRWTPSRVCSYVCVSSRVIGMKMVEDRLY